MTREEAINEIKSWAIPSKKGKEVLETLIPELRESKDERINKAIFKALSKKEARDVLFAEGVQISDALAYLEKQKEQKPVHTAKEMWKEMRLEVYAQASGNRHEPNYSDDSTKMFSLCDIDEIFEKIGSSTVGSQTAEWSEEDEKMLKSVIWHISNSVTNGKNTDCKCDLTEWLMNRLKFLRPQPHWKPSEEHGCI